MANIQTCKNGHNYDANIYETCPYCPKERRSANTQLNQGYGSAMATQAAPDAYGGASNDARTRAVGSHNNNNSAPLPQGTCIIGPGMDQNNGVRRLVGFLVSYDIAATGASFKVLEGKNLIGSSIKSDIVIDADQGVSGSHLTILYRGGVYRFRDEFSTNGTFINGVAVEEGVLKDKDVIRVGNTQLIFLAIPQPTL